MPIEPVKDWITWQDFNLLVDGLCPLESKRMIGTMCDATTAVWPRADGSSVYYRNHIRQAILDLANFIPEYVKSHETIYYPQDFTRDGEASVGALPAGAEIQSMWYYSTCRGIRYPVKTIGWERRFDLASHRNFDTLNSDYTVLTAASLGALAIEQQIAALKISAREKVGIAAISPKHDQFYCFPAVRGEWMLSVFWDGQKMEWRDQEYVPFDEEAARAVAYWVQAEFYRYIDRDAGQAAAAMAMYANKRSNIYTRLKEKGI